MRNTLRDAIVTGEDTMRTVISFVVPCTLMLSCSRAPEAIGSSPARVVAVLGPEATASIAHTAPNQLVIGFTNGAADDQACVLERGAKNSVCLAFVRHRKVFPPTNRVHEARRGMEVERGLITSIPRRDLQRGN
jgi:hypothetical protein